MLIRILVEDEKEILFNADCQVALLLDSVKKSHNIPQSEVIDLCTIDGILKDLYKHENDNALSFFKPRELCLVVAIQNAKTPEPVYVPVLKEYADNKCFDALLNSKEEKMPQIKPKYRSIASTSVSRGSTDGGRVGSGKKTRRRFTHNSDRDGHK